MISQGRWRKGVGENTLLAPLTPILTTVCREQI